MQMVLKRTGRCRAASRSMSTANTHRQNSLYKAVVLKVGVCEAVYEPVRCKDSRCMLGQLILYTMGTFSLQVSSVN